MCELYNFLRHTTFSVFALFCIYSVTQCKDMVKEPPGLFSQWGGKC